MPDAKPWLKMWVEWIDDPKMDRLSLEEQGAWWRLVSLAHRCAAGGRIITGGVSLSVEEILKTLKVSDPHEQEAFRRMVDKMTSWGSLQKDGGALFITNYKKRQEMIPSNTPEAVAARQRLHRSQALKGIPKSHLSLGQELRSVLRDLPSFDSYLKEHERFKDELAKLGAAKGYTVRRELPVTEGRVDICWEQAGQIMAAFEIDAVLPKYKSLVKLRSLKAPAFVILRRGRNPYQWEQDVLLIGLNRPRPLDEPEQEIRDDLPSPGNQDTKDNKNIEEEGRSVTGEMSRKSRDSLIVKEITGLIVETKKEPFTEVLADRIRQFPEWYTGPVDWIKKAFATAPLNKRRWDYVMKILQRWQDEGGPDGRTGQREADERRGANEADQRGAPEHGRKLPWKARRGGPEQVPGTEDQR